MTEQRYLDERDIIYVVEVAEGLHKNLDKFVEVLNLSLSQSVQDVTEQNPSKTLGITDSYHITAGAKNEIISRFGVGYNEIPCLESGHFVLDVTFLLSELFRVGVTCQNTEILGLLVRSGFNDKRRLWDSIQLAVETENLDIVRIVIKMGIPLNSSDPERQVCKTALGIAIQKRNVAMVKLLLESGFDTEIRDGVRDNETALMLATDQGWREGWELLLKYGAKPLPENCFIEYLPLMAAIRTLKDDCVDSIMNLLNETLTACTSDLMREKISSAALGVAVFRTHYNIVKYLLDMNVSPDRVLLSERLKEEEFETLRFYETPEQRPFDYLDVILHFHTNYHTFQYGSVATANTVEYLYAPALWITRYLSHDNMIKMSKILLDYKANPDIFLDCFGGKSMLTTCIFIRGSIALEFMAEMLLSNADASRRTWCPKIDQRTFFWDLSFLTTENSKAFIKALLANGFERNEGLGYFMSDIIAKVPYLTVPNGVLNGSHENGRNLYRLYTEVTEVMAEMPRLVDLCRVVIRQKLRHSNRLIRVEAQVSTLPIPQKMKKFVLLEDLKFL